VEKKQRAFIFMFFMTIEKVTFFTSYRDKIVYDDYFADMKYNGL